MTVNIGATGRGLAVLLGLGAVILAAIDAQAWPYFLGCSVFLFIFPMFFSRYKRKHRKRRF